MRQYGHLFTLLETVLVGDMTGKCHPAHAGSVDFFYACPSTLFTARAPPNSALVPPRGVLTRPVLLGHFIYCAFVNDHVISMRRGH